MRRRKHRFPPSTDKSLGLSNGSGHQSGGSSEGPDPSSSELSADTVIYVGPSCEETDGEHPPVYLPSLSSGDNRGVMSKALKGSAADKSPMKKVNPPKSSSPLPGSPKKYAKVPKLNESSPSHVAAYSNQNAPREVPRVKHQPGVSKGSNVPTPKGSPMKRPNPPPSSVSQYEGLHGMVMPQEQWIDGPRVSRSRVAEARHLLREINHVKSNETWIDGPSATISAAALPQPPAAGYGFMDNHKKSMIRQWVENQSSQMFPPTTAALQRHLTQLVLPNHRPPCNDDVASLRSEDLVNPISRAGFNNLKLGPASSESLIRTGLKSSHNLIPTNLHVPEPAPSGPIIDNLSEKSNQRPASNEGQEEEDQDSGPSEVPPALPLIEPLGSREISHDSLHLVGSRHISQESLALAQQQSIEMMDCGLQVTEDDILRTMGSDHPLSALSNCDMSVVSSFHPGDAFSECALGDAAK